MGKIPWRRERLIHSSVLTWRIPWLEEPGELQSMELQRHRHEQLTHTHTHTPRAFILKACFSMMTLKVSWFPSHPVGENGAELESFILPARPLCYWSGPSILGSPAAPSVHPSTPRLWPLPAFHCRNNVQHFRLRHCLPEGLSLGNSSDLTPASSGTSPADCSWFHLETSPRERSRMLDQR